MEGSWKPHESPMDTRWKLIHHHFEHPESSSLWGPHGSTVKMALLLSCMRFHGNISFKGLNPKNILFRSCTRKLSSSVCLCLRSLAKELRTSLKFQLSRALSWRNTPRAKTFPRVIVHHLADAYEVLAALAPAMSCCLVSIDQLRKQ